MAINYASLQSEITNDPLTLGYAGKTDVQKAALLNALTGGGTGTVFRNDIKPTEVLNTIVSADFISLSQLNTSKLEIMLLMPVLDATNANLRTNFLNIFTGLSNTITALTALAQRTGSRAEVLFGTGTVIQASDIGIARNGS